MPKIDFNDYAAKHGIQAARAHTDEQANAAVIAELSKFKTAWDLLNKHQRQKRPAVITNLGRERDVVNIVAQSKLGKTWFIQNMALCVAAGIPFLTEDWQCSQGKVVIVDNELHEDTIADRLPFICERMGLPLQETLEQIVIFNLRGCGLDINSISPLMTDIKMLQPRMVIFDSLYRFLPAGVSEMDSGGITQIYSVLDKYAAIIQTAMFALIIHTTKGGQSDKGVMEVGSGTAAFGRATDNHVIIREHETEGLFVIEAGARDWPQQAPIVVKKEIPLFTAVQGEDPTKLKAKVVSSNTKDPITPEVIKNACCGIIEPESVESIVQKIQEKTGRGENACRRAFKAADKFFKRVETPRDGMKPKIEYVWNEAEWITHLTRQE